VDRPQEIAATCLRLPFAGDRQHGLPVDGYPGLQVAVQRINPRQQRLRQRHRRQAAIPDPGRSVNYGKFVRIGHHSTSSYRLDVGAALTVGIAA
jgi:hypothetical protein